MADIRNIVVLMLENRSFDSMLGRLRAAGPDYDGVSGRESQFTNHWNGKDYKVWASPNVPLPPDIATIPDPDPGELFSDMTEQIYGVGKSPPDWPANMSGFVANYMAQASDKPGIHRQPVPQNIMHGFTPEQLPAMSALANAFGVSDQWHASAPDQTWPNRFFAHAATADGYVNNLPEHYPYMMPTIYNQLEIAKVDWRIYYHDLPQAALLARLDDHMFTKILEFEGSLLHEGFLKEAEAGKLKPYTFIEPRYYPSMLSGKLPNDQHPPHDVTYGEKLIAQVYNAIRKGPQWENTLFIITYDEHGGTYDHVPPGPAVPPDDKAPDGFTFDRYGVRVPAVLISPWIPGGTVIRPAKGPYPFDHTSIIKTVRETFAPHHPSLTKRDAAAPSLLSALSLSAPSNGGPAQIPVPQPVTAQEDVAAACAAPAGALHRAFAECFGVHVPDMKTAMLAQDEISTEDAHRVAKAGFEKLREKCSGR